MMVSTRGRYALRVLIDLSEHNNGSYIPMKDVAARQEISLKYLERILPTLTKAKLIEGVHGKGGGYKLTRAPEDYTVGEVLRLTEGDLAPVA
ncbi:MAG: Rrf2 family transcriptional regulator, partial [Ruminococcus sp.]|uniref:RrF2 family transcriptional regulator n=1 Tax=Ruminococcus sp. TaxID=41978 RepID=UPI0028734F32